MHLKHRSKLLLLSVLLTLVLVLPFMTVQAQGCTYTVKPGDTLAKIALQHGISVAQLQDLNDEKYPTIWNGIIIPGWVLNVPCTASATPVSPQPPSQPQPTPSGVVTGTPSTNMNIRAGAGTNYPVIGTAAQGVPLTLEARNAASTWVLFRNGAKRGWLAAWLLTISGNVASLPISNEVIGNPPIPPVSPQPPAPPETPAGGGGNPPTGTGLYTGKFSYFEANVKTIYQRGLERGNYPNRFTTIGDSETDQLYFLKQFDYGDYYLGKYTYLKPMITQFAGSFDHRSQAAQAGFVIESILDPTWADPNACLAGENVVACEYRLWRPSIVIILVRTYPGSAMEEQYYENLRRIVDLSIEQGVIPVLSTLPWIHPGGQQVGMNDKVRRLAAAYQIPLWDLYATTSILPNHGVQETNSHLSIPTDWAACNFTQPYLDQFGINHRNLEALEALHYLTKVRQ